MFPPHEVVRNDNATPAEKTLALMCKRLLEMDVPEGMARILLAAKDRAWGEFHTDLGRQLWDEVRHAMIGKVYFEPLGADWCREILVHTGFSQRLNLYMSDVEAHAVLYAIEQSPMPTTTGKHYEWETASTTKDGFAAMFQDSDWADEVMHARIGRHWAVSERGLAREEVTAMAHRAGQESARHWKKL